MKAILEFNLPEEQTEFTAATKSLDLVAAISEFERYLRSSIKYDESITEEKMSTLVDVRAELWRIVSDHFIDELLV